MSDVIKGFGMFGGLAGLGLALVLYTFREIIRKNIFPTLTPDHANDLLRLLALLVFTLSILSIIAWLVNNHLDRTTHSKSSPQPAETIDSMLAQPINTAVFRFVVRTTKDKRNGPPNATGTSMGSDIHFAVGMIGSPKALLVATADKYFFTADEQGRCTLEGTAELQLDQNPEKLRGSTLQNTNQLIFGGRSFEGYGDVERGKLFLTINGNLSAQFEVPPQHIGPGGRIVVGIAGITFNVDPDPLNSYLAQAPKLHVQDSVLIRR